MSAYAFYTASKERERGKEREGERVKSKYIVVMIIRMYDWIKIIVVDQQLYIYSGYTLLGMMNAAICYHGIVDN